MTNRKLFSRRTSSIIVSVIVLLIAFAQTQGWISTATQEASQNQPGLYEVDHFVDGDTITVKMNGRSETVRMIGVDTPETHRPNTPVQCYGPAAAAHTKSLIGNSKVRLESDETNQNRDRYGRLLRYVYLPDGRLLQKEIISGGYGFAYTSFPFTKKAEFKDTEKQAKENNRGLWRNCTVTEENGRKQTSPAG